MTSMSAQPDAAPDARDTPAVLAFIERFASALTDAGNLAVKLYTLLNLHDFVK